MCDLYGHFVLAMCSLVQVIFELLGQCCAWCVWKCTRGQRRWRISSAASKSSVDGNQVEGDLHDCEACVAALLHNED